MTVPSDPALVPSPRSFAAMRHAKFRWFFGTFMLAIMADNIEHVISYWVMYQHFHSPALGGFAVLSHWLPYLLFSIPVGALADRVDPRRLIQLAMVMFTSVSLGWGYFFVTGTLHMWGAMLLLAVHGCAGVFWMTSSQLLLHEVVPPEDLQSGVRLNATAGYTGTLVGPAVGGAMLFGLGPAYGILLNAAFYLPLLLWLFRAPRPRNGEDALTRPAIQGLHDIVNTFRTAIRMRSVFLMTLLAGAASFFVGNSYQAQMPNFAHDLGDLQPGVAYSMLLAADAAGGLRARELQSPSPKAGDRPNFRGLLVRCAGSICADAVLPAGAGLPVHRRLLRASLRQHGADRGAIERAYRNQGSHPGAVQYGGARMPRIRGCYGRDPRRAFGRARLALNSRTADARFCNFPIPPATQR